MQWPEKHVNGMSGASWRILAIPAKPAPMITISAFEGRSLVLRKSSKGRASAFQKEVVGLGTGARSGAILKCFFRLEVADVKFESHPL